jgi:signal transduction histidine kinase
MPNGGTVTVTLGSRSATPPGEDRGTPRDYCFISVDDEGPGIREEDKSHLFEPFYTTKGTGEGTGLGLSVSYGIVQDHQGWIDVRSEPGKGSCFTVYLPRETA